MPSSTRPRAEDPPGMCRSIGHRLASIIVSSSDPVADNASLKRFLDAYGAKHEIAIQGDRKALLILGPEDFPSNSPHPQGRQMAVRYGSWPPRKSFFAASVATSSTQFKQRSPM